MILFFFLCPLCCVVKTAVKENVPGLSFITKLVPVTYRWDTEKLADFDGRRPLKEAEPARRQSGFLAQDVEAIAKGIGYEFSGVGKPPNERTQYGLAYGEFVVPLVKAIQEQQQELRALKTRIAHARSHALQQRAEMFAGSPSMIGLLAVGLALLIRRRRVVPWRAREGAEI